MENEKAYSIKYEMDENQGILIREIAGEMGMADIIDMWKKDIANGSVNKNLKAVITDFSSGKNLSKMSELKSIATYYEENFDLLENIKIAVVLDDNTVAIPLMYQHGNPKIQHSVFSTLVAAIAWVKE